MRVSPRSELLKSFNGAKKNTRKKLELSGRAAGKNRVPVIVIWQRKFGQNNNQTSRAERKKKTEICHKNSETIKRDTVGQGPGQTAEDTQDTC